MSENHQHDQSDALPAELRRVHQHLLGDGDAWRAEYPASAEFRERVEAFQRSAVAQAYEPGAQRRTMRVSDSMHMAPPPTSTPLDSPPTRVRRRYLRGVLAVAAAIMVAALFAVAFQKLSVSGPAQQQHAPTATPSASVWQSVGQFQSRNGERVAVAPSDPYVVYRLKSATFAMERSDDGGATWLAITFPPELRLPSLRTNPVFDISPVNPNIVYLTTFGDPSKMVCESSIPPGGRVPATKCTEQYVTTDGGKNWQRLTLPENGQLTGMLTQVFGSPRAPLIPQGSRVYSLMTLVGPTLDSYRLVVSSDGVHWQTADSALTATDQRIESYLASPTGSTVWATLADNSLWRSDDAGTNWERVGPLPRNQAQETMGLVAARVVGANSFLYSAAGSPPLGDIAPDGMRVSSDGGKSWQPSPTAGIPDGQHAAPHSAMTLSDGTLVALFRTTQLNIAFDEGILHNAAYYAWKPGATSWTRLTPTFDAEAVQQQWITPANDAKPHESIWVFIYRDPNLTYEGNDNYVKDGQYTISHISLVS